MIMQDVETTDTTPLMEEVFSENCDNTVFDFDWFWFTQRIYLNLSHVPQEIHVIFKFRIYSARTKTWCNETTTTSLKNCNVEDTYVPW